jgi:hypothetical protein
MNNARTFYVDSLRMVICFMSSSQIHMKNIKESCLEFFQNEDIRKDVREIIKPIVDIIYNEIYIYVWCICFFNVFLMFIILANLFILLHYVRKLQITI